MKHTFSCSVCRESSLVFIVVSSVPNAVMCMCSQPVLRPSVFSLFSWLMFNLSQGPLQVRGATQRHRTETETQDRDRDTAQRQRDSTETERQHRDRETAQRQRYNTETEIQHRDRENALIG